MIIGDVKHDIKDFLDFPHKSPLTAEDPLRAALDKIDEMAAEISDNAEAWEDFECAECADLETENKNLQDEVDDLNEKVAELEKKLKALGVSE